MKWPAGLRQSVLAEITPPPALTRQAQRAARDVIARIRKEGRKRGLDVAPRLVGSLYKRTHLRSPLDIDVFVLFPPQTPRKDLEKHGVGLGQAVLDRPTLKYAEHPYVHGAFDGLVFDVVPAYRLRTVAGRISAVDRSPFHARLVKSALKPRQADDVRLLKQFLRGIGCYGAETATGGASGYLAELLVLKFGTFERTLYAIAEWTPPVVLALKGAPAGLGGPLVFVDPVDPNRNAAAAVQPATLERLIRAAAAFLRSPRREFFFPRMPQALPAARLRSLLRRGTFLALEIPPPAGREETKLPQAQRLLAKLKRALEQEGFRVRRASVQPTGARRFLLVWEYTPKQLPPSFLHRGPRVADRAHVDRFVAKWSRHPDALAPPAPRGGRWVVRVRRSARTPRELLSARLGQLAKGITWEDGEPPARGFLDPEALAADPSRHVPLTVLLRRLDPWKA